MTAIYVDTMRQELEGWPGFNYQNWQTAAQFCADHKINLEEALVWADRAISEPFRNAAMGREDFSTLHTKADVLRALQRDADADAVMARAIVLPATSAFELYGYGSQLLAAGSRDKALDVFTPEPSSASGRAGTGRISVSPAGTPRPTTRRMQSRSGRLR